MLHALFGNANLEKILLFLFVNETGYGSQIHTLLNTPLTPIQNGLNRLEKGGVVKSRRQGKTHLYQIDPLYPFYQELIALLKRAYTLLPPPEKKKYCLFHKPRLPFDKEMKRSRTQQKELTAFWERLQRVKTLIFSAKLRHGSVESEKTGQGEALVTRPNQTTLLLQERGVWLAEEKPQHTFHNTLRWSLDAPSALISLEHLRYGEGNPVFLFHLAPTKPGLLESIDAHLCSEDTYLGRISWDADSIDFHWRVIGAKKNDELHYRYF